MSFESIRLQLMWDRLLSVVEEQAQTLIRVGFSTSTREAGDVSAGLFDPAGSMLAQAVTGTPGHVNAMARSVRHFLAKFPADTMRPGDVFATNDPWKGTGTWTISRLARRPSGPAVSDGRSRQPRTSSTLAAWG